MAAKEAKVSVTVKLELSEEQLRDIFESYDIKFTKKKVKELDGEINENEAVWLSDLEESFEEIIGNWINEMFDE